AAPPAPSSPPTRTGSITSPHDAVTRCAVTATPELVRARDIVIVSVAAVTVDPGGIWLRSNATSARRDCPVLFRPTNMYCPSPLLPGPRGASYSVLSRDGTNVSWSPRAGKTIAARPAALAARIHPNLIALLRPRPPHGLRPRRSVR